MDTEYSCMQCKKQYASYKSLWNHNKKFHNTSIIPDNTSNNTLIILNNTSINTSQYNCRKCNKSFNNYQNRWKHEKICKSKETKEKEKDRLLEQQRLEIEALKLKLQISNKEKGNDAAVTVKKINKALQMQNSNNNNNNTITNNIVNNNIQLLQLGEEYRKCNIPQLLTNNEQIDILNSRRFSLQKIIELLHGGSGKYKQFKNLIVTNIRNKTIYKYDETKDAFILASSDIVMELLIDSRLSDLETIYDQNNHKISDTTKRSLERFINEMREPDSDSRKFEIEQIKMLLFNDRDKIMNDLQNEISLVLTVNEVD